jgi:hypothetical protein
VTAPDPDRRLDERLAADGARWRAAQPAAPEPDPARLTATRRPRWQPLAAAAAVVAVAAGGVAGVTLSRRATDSPPAGRVTGQTAGPALDPSDIVRDGDRVAGQGLFFAPPDGPVRLCGPLGGPPRMSYEPWPDPLNTPDMCRNALTVTGLRTDQLSNIGGRDGAAWGSARVEGVYQAGTLTVTRQEPYVSRRKDPGAADPVPCPEPPGGWPPGDVERAARGLNVVIGKHRRELNEVYVAYPYGWHLQDQSNRKGTMVYVVGTTGDVAAARRLLEAVFPAEYLCVRKARWSAAQMGAAVRQLQTSPEAARLHVAAGDKDVIGDRVTARMLVVTEPVARLLRSVAGGRIVPTPILHKVR